MEVLETMFKGRWVKVQISAPTYAFPHISIGYIYCLQGRRLLDHLNDVFPGMPLPNNDFLSVKSVVIHSLSGEVKTVPFACLNKANIIFVKELDAQTKGLTGDKPYPYVSKSLVAVKIYLPFYVLTGYMHCVKGERTSDVMNLPLRFLPLTDVNVSLSTGSSESGVSFMAVNKGQIILLEELSPQTSEQ